MKKINITVVCAGEAEYPGCAELLEDYPGFRLLARAADLEDGAIWDALAVSDVLVLDEAVLDVVGHRAIRKLHDNFPAIRSLMVVDGEHEYKTLAAISLGVQGVIAQTSTVALLRKAVIALYSGEAWLSRGLAQPLREQANQADGLACWSDLSPDPQARGKLN